MPTFEEVIEDFKEIYFKARPNVVLAFPDLGGGIEYVGISDPDSGLNIPDEWLVIEKITTPSTQFQLQDARIRLPNISIVCNDNHGRISGILREEESFYFEGDFFVYFGFTGVAMDFSDYKKSPVMRFKRFGKSGITNISLDFQDKLSFLTKEAFQVVAPLDIDIDDVVTSFDVITDEDIYLSSGVIKIDDELMTFSGKVFGAGITTLSGIVRGYRTTDAVEHKEDSAVFQVAEIEENPVDALLQLLISTAGDASIYDVLFDGGGIPEADLDIASFLAIKASKFPIDTIRLFAVNIDNLINFIEQDVLLPNNIRLVVDALNDKIKLVEVSDTTSADPIFELDESRQILSSQRIVTESRRIINRLTVNWAYIEGKGFTRQSVVELTSSQDVYGVRDGILEIKGAQVDLSGSSIVLNRGNIYLSKFAFPQYTIKLKGDISTANLTVGDVVRLTMDGFISPESATSYSRPAEILQRKYQHDSLTNEIELLDSPFSAILRIGNFSPSSEILEVFSQSSIRIAEEEIIFYDEGDILALFDVGADSYLPNFGSRDINEISTIDGNGVITFVSPWVEIVQVGQRVPPADFDQASTSQQNRFAWFSDENNNFPDASSPYVFGFG